MMIKALFVIALLAVPACASAAPPTGDARLQPGPSTAFAETLFMDRPASNAAARPPIVISVGPSTRVSLASASIAIDASAPRVRPSENQAVVIVPGAVPEDRKNVSVLDGRESFVIYGWSLKITDVLLVLFTGLLALFTLGLWWSTWRLWSEAKEGRSIAEASARAAERSAEAAHQSAQVSSAAEQPRWIVKSMSLTVHDTGGGTTDTACRIVATLTNHGRTPAEITRTAFHWKVAVLLEPRARQPMHSVAHAENFGNVVGPGGDLRITLDARLTEEQTQQLRRGAIHLWAWGYVAYRTYLDQHMVKGFIGVLDAHPTRRLPNDEGEQEREGEPGRRYGHVLEGALRQPTASAQVQSYVYTRPDDIGEAEATGVARPIDA